MHVPVPIVALLLRFSILKTFELVAIGELASA